MTPTAQAHTNGAPHGDLGKLRELLGKLPLEGCRLAREIAQKECDTDIRSHESLLSRANTLLGASGVGVSLLVGFSKESAAVDSTVEITFFGLALAAASLSVLLVVLSAMIKGAATSIDNRTIAGEVLDTAQGVDELRRSHEGTLALTYLEIRINLAERHRRRAKILGAAQWTYLAFLVMVCAFGVSIPL